jgi:general secretion pathway protein K
VKVPPSERGAALLAVLVLVVIMAGIAAGAFERLRLSTALAINGASLDQSRAYAVGLETLLTLRVDDLVAENPEMTNAASGWNGRVRRVRLPGEGEAEAAISDGGNCFNLNSVAQGEGAMPLQRRPLGITQFANLMIVLGAPEATARDIAESAGDWVDADSAAGPDGGEDSLYAAADTPYLPGNTMFAEVSELRAVNGVSPELYARLQPYLCALPTTDLSPININTLRADQGPLIAMFAPEAIGLGAARQVLSRRPPTGWSNISQFWQDPLLKNAVMPLEVQLQPKLVTRWFAIDLKVRLRGAELVETALVDARRTPANIVVRRWGSEG